MKKIHAISIMLIAVLLSGCGTPAGNNSYITPQQISEPKIAEVTPVIEIQIERVNNCDGTNPTYNVSYKTIQTQKASFEVTVGAGGLVTGTPVPTALEVQLEAKITAALAKDYGLTTEKNHDLTLDNPQGKFLEHTIEWKVTRVKGLIEVVYGDGIAQVIFDKIANVELHNRTSQSLGCGGNVVSVLPTATDSGFTPIATLETQPPVINPTTTVVISGGDLTSCSAFKNGETRQISAGTFVIGDIIIDGVAQYDSGGTKEGTVAYFEKESSVTAQWGAGCYIGSKSLAEQIIQGELEHGCGSKCISVRFVLVQSDGQQEVQYFK